MHSSGLSDSNVIVRIGICSEVGNVIVSIGVLAPDSRDTGESKDVALFPPTYSACKVGTPDAGIAFSLTGPSSALAYTRK